MAVKTDRIAHVTGGELFPRAAVQSFADMAEPAVCWTWRQCWVSTVGLWVLSLWGD